jgi:pimeloyl-ACP methyl ester carboxylesterase
VRLRGKGRGTAGGLFDGGALPCFVGHSFGSRAVARAAEQRGDSLSGAILIDSAIAAYDQIRNADISDKHRLYPTLAAALARFNLAPPQPCENLNEELLSAQRQKGGTRNIIHEASELAAVLWLR